MKNLVRIFLIASFPLLLFLVWLRIMLLPAFIEIEYRRPGFPDDPYGFSVEERIRWANVSRSYLLSNAGEDYFAQYHLADGAPLYNEREMQHMADVHNLVQTGMTLLVVLLVLYLAGGAFLFWKSRDLLWRTLAAAGIGTFGLLVFLLVAVGLAWDWAFVTFHRVFFTGETWLFPYSDSLIRLFPVSFWQDGFAAAAIGMLATCLLVFSAAHFLPGRMKRKRPSDS
jgi:integral membrane protein (TIGR01906 family)